MKTLRSFIISFIVCVLLISGLSSNIVFADQSDVVSSESIQDYNVKLDKDNYVYKGDTIEPEVTLYKGEEIVDSNFYTLTYYNNDNLGIGTVVINDLSGNPLASGNFNIVGDLVSVDIINYPSSVLFNSSGVVDVVMYDSFTSRELIKDVDYVINIIDTKKVGKSKLEINGINSYIGSISFDIDVLPIDIKNTNIKIISTTQKWTGNQLVPAILVLSGNTILTEGLDYKITYSNNINPGTANVKITGIGNYTGSNSSNFNIIKAVKDLSVSLSSTNYVYDGKAKVPTVTVKDGIKILKLNQDYTLKYESNVKVGTAKVVITGKGNYEQTLTKTFVIKNDITKMNISLPKSSLTWTGKAVYSEPVVKHGSKTLKKNVDYTISFSNNVNAGKASVTITGKGNYSEKVTKTYNIIKPTSKLSITLSSTSYTYDGKSKTPQVTVKDGNKVLKQNTDYTLKYSNNTKVGTAKVTITGKGYYTSTVTKNFLIKNDIRKMNINLPKSSLTWTGKAVYSEPVVKHGSKTLKKNVDYTISFSNNVNAGKASVTITGKGNYSEKVTKTYNIIKPTSKLSITLSSTSYTYDGKSKTPQVTVKDGNKVLKQNTDYTLKYGNNTKVGTGKVTITGKGYYTSTVTKNFLIKNDLRKAMITLPKTSLVWTGKAISNTPIVKHGNKVLKNGVDYTVSYSNNVNTGKASVIIKGKGSYAETVTKTFTIYEDISKSSVKFEFNTYYDFWVPTKPNVTVKYGNTTLKLGKDYTISYKNNNGPGTGTVVIKGIGSYGGTLNKTFKINELDSIGDGTYRAGYDIPPGLYLVFATDEIWGGYVSTSYDRNGYDIIANQIFSYNTYINVEHGEFFTINRGQAYVDPYSPFVPVNDSGMYSVGIDIKPGRYLLTMTDDYSYYAIHDNPINDDWSIIVNDLFYSGSRHITVYEGEYLEINNLNMKYLGK